MPAAGQAAELAEMPEEDFIRYLGEEEKKKYLSLDMMIWKNWRKIYNRGGFNESK